MISARSGIAELLGEVTLTTFGGAGVVVELPRASGPLVVSFSFVSDEDVEDVAVRSLPATSGLALELVNFDTADGRGSAWPVPLREEGVWTIFLHFRVWKFGKTPDRTVHFTFYRAQSDQVFHEGTPGGPFSVKT
jgi:hypothetical protein